MVQDLRCPHGGEARRAEGEVLGPGGHEGHRPRKWPGGRLDAHVRRRLGADDGHTEGVGQRDEEPARSSPEIEHRLAESRDVADSSVRPQLQRLGRELATTVVDRRHAPVVVHLPHGIEPTGTDLARRGAMDSAPSAVENPAFLPRHAEIGHSLFLHATSVCLMSRGMPSRNDTTFLDGGAGLLLSWRCAMTIARWKPAATALVAVLILLSVPAAASAHPGRGGSGRGGDDSGHPSSPGSAVVTTESGPYGTVLVVGGSGAGFVPGQPGPAYPAGSALYTPTIDPLVGGDGDSYQPGCDATTQAVSVLEESQDPAIPPGGPYPPFTCAGSETDPTADWPALTTDGPPVAGSGVDRRLLGSVYRSDIGASQVTYAGHPLYLFDPGPSSFAGEDFFETAPPLFPWHTAWYLVSPDGLEDPGTAGLVVQAPQSGTSYSTPVLSATMLPAIGGLPVTVYTLDGEHGHHGCGQRCADEIVPLLTIAAPTAGMGVDPGAIGTVTRHDGSQQVTYNGQPLYLYMQEVPFIGTTGPATTGNGDGVEIHGRTLQFVSP